MTALFREDALSVHYYRDARMRRWVDRVLEQGAIGRALIFSSAMAQYVEARHALRRIADLVDVDSRKWQQYAEESRWPLSWLLSREARTLLAYERKVAETFDASVFVSRAEAELFRTLAGTRAAGKVCYAENGVDSAYFDPELASECPYESNTRTLVFTGAMDYKPNVDAADWFARIAFPRIVTRWPDARFAIVGARPDPRVRALAAHNGVLVTGSVPDVRPYLAHAVAVVAPLRIARGIQNKVLEGMAMAKIVIASAAAAEGIDAEPEREILLADSVGDYVRALALVFEGAFTELGRNARSRILTSYGWAANLDRIGRLLAEAPGSPATIGGHAAAAA
jgi:sugar transferase (PEP-CTERM/EpsH1 system associated)